jgi:hypothetical protein
MEQTNRTEIKSHFYNKAERISSAVFLIANLIPEKEQLGLKIKNLTINMISYLAHVKEPNFPENMSYIGKVEVIKKQICSFMDISRDISLISDMNVEIIKRELDLLMDNLLEIKAKSNLLNDKLYLLSNNTESKVQSKNSVKSVESIKDITNNKRVDSKGHNRKRAILELIRFKKTADIKDVAAGIKGCSEKTIQRSLSSLVNEGLIRRVGERRWSKYLLA